MNFEDQKGKNGVCPGCRRTPAQALADATALGLIEELQTGVFICCQVAKWADEQRLAWRAATVESWELVRRRDVSDSDEQLVPVLVGKRRSSAKSQRVA